MPDNKNTFSHPEVVQYYSDYTGLQPAEEAILGIIRHEIRGKCILDIGVGAGRTVPHLAPLASEYTAIDYSPDMIQECIIKYGQRFPHACFKAMDAKDISSEKGMYDFIIFSFNGIDYVNYEERCTILKKLHETCSPGGILAFSTHNLRCVKKYFGFHRSFNPAVLLQNFTLFPKLKRMNKEALSAAGKSDYIFLNDGAHDFGLTTCYIKPEAQVTALQNTGFNLIQVFGRNGREIPLIELDKNSDYWLYYLCRTDR